VLYQNCCFVVIPTLYEGAGSGVLTDALTIGKPVLCSKIPQILEQIHNYKDIEVLLIEPESVQDITDKLEYAWRDLTDLTRRASNNSEILSRSYSFSWHKWAEVHVNLFRKFIK
jgi:glycosyltransferase involved in cell wall biosynthesis